MSGLEVIGAISGVITLIEATITVYDSVQKDLRLSETFKTVRRRLPLIRDTLQACKETLELKHVSLPADVHAALEETIEACDKKARILREIFEKVIPGENDKWGKRYAKALKNVGNGSKVEVLMMDLAHDVQTVVNHHAVKSATPEQISNLEEIIAEMKEIRRSELAKDLEGMTFSSEGGSQTINARSHIEQQINNNAPVTTQNFHSVTLEPKYDFSFREPIGMHLGHAPYMSPELFVGREEELEQMRSILLPDKKSIQPLRLVVGGMGGVGKTQLVIEYANRYSFRYKSICWLNASSIAALEAHFRGIAGQIFGASAVKALNHGEVVVCVHRWLSYRQNTEWLLIFDSYDEPSQFELSKYYPSTSHGTIIVTTRRLNRVAGTKVHLRAFQSVEEGLHILAKRSERDQLRDDPYAATLVKRLAGLPLALATTGEYLRASLLSFQEYYQMYDERWNVDVDDPVELDEYPNRTLYTTWSLTYTQLESTRPAAAQLLRLLAYFDNQEIWYELLSAGDSATIPWLNRILSGRQEFLSVMRTLTNFCLIDIQYSKQSWSVHACVHDWLLHELNSELASDLYFYAFDCIVASIDMKDWELLDQVIYRRVSHHAARLVYQRFEEDEEISSGLAIRSNQMATIARMLHMNAEFFAAEKMYRRACTEMDKWFGPEHDTTLVTIHNFALLLDDLDKFDEAEKMYHRVLAGRDSSRASGMNSIFSTYYNLAGLFDRKGDTKQAERLCRLVLAGRKILSGTDNLSTLRVMHFLGVLCKHLHNFQEAEDLFMSVMTEGKTSFGLHPFITIRVRADLGMLYLEQVKFEKAESVLVEALSEAKRIFGPDHSSVINISHNLGLVYDEQGRHRLALTMYMNALNGRERMLGPAHSLTLLTVQNIGNVYRQQHKLAEAEEMFNRALNGQEKLFGPDHISTLDAVNNLGLVYREQGKYQDAENMYLRALKGYKSKIASGHRSMVRALENLGSLYLALGKLDQAEGCLKQALNQLEKTYGLDHQQSLDAIQYCGSLYLAQERYEEAEKMFLRALAGRQQYYGSERMTTIQSAASLGRLYSAQGKLEQAEEMCKRALKGAEKLLGLEHRYTIIAAIRLGLVYRDHRNFGEAARVLVQALDGSEKLSGMEHDDTIDIVLKLAFFYGMLGDYAKSKQMYERALASRVKALGPHHFKSLEISNLLGHVALMLANTEKA